ncbi:pumilio-family RNA-binding repeat protein [Niveomyces insectorum RCEF 264]|uniref:Pumilio-family RNA-binding repeat protein n=1 Tax=Niveomyces insectorum RCEF 264 TaxID=1081102 RepID=A0A167X1E4_9HYPO|nr:pumilio-family RNA-binding repeat protein [Niveomyces insectorum RCEF 264]
MSAGPSTGSPLQRRSSGSRGFSQDENMLKYEDASLQASKDTFSAMRKGVVTLATSKFANHMGTKPVFDAESSSAYPMDSLLAKLSEQQAAIREQNDNLAKAEEDAAYAKAIEHQQSRNALPVAPAADGLIGTSASTIRSTSLTPQENVVSAEELLRLKVELAQAQNKINRLDQELAHSRTAKPDNTPGLPPLTAPGSEFPAATQGEQVSFRGTGGLIAAPVAKHLYMHDTIWSPPGENPADAMDASSAGTFGRSRAVWPSDLKQVGFQHTFSANPVSAPLTSAPIPPPPAPIWPTGRPGNHNFAEPFPQAFGNVSSSTDSYRENCITPDNDMILRPPSQRPGNRLESRFTAGHALGTYGAYNPGQLQYDSSVDFSATSGSQMINATGLGVYSHSQQQPIGTPLSPHAPEFSGSSAPPWKNEHTPSESQTFMPTTEPLNYRRLLDRNVNCNWKYIVDKIVSSNDQQASIFLQQKLKVGTSDQKYEIVEAIAAQAYALMVNRFGNFLVQRCFEHGSPEQIIKIAEAIRGNTLSLSMDPFGCHVVQKAFDSVPENYKAIMVHELLRRIPETIIHRYACHVWQKLFELRWNDSPPQIMKYVNEALRGMWHEVALGETGSLVVQNIFENCLEEDKRPCIEEVLQNISLVAEGQFGNWCIQHICEHGAPGDRSRAIDHVIEFAPEYSMDQFASKVVEKCLKIGGNDFLNRYLDRVCEGRVGRPRIPLIDIASDQYGNYLIQYILTHASPQHRDLVAAHIRKHMVSLRGSKFGSRVGMLCTNPAVATRPGPGVGPPVGRLPPRYGSGPPRHRGTGTPSLYNPE